MRGGIDPRDYRFRPRFFGVGDVWKDLCSGDGTLSSRVALALGFPHSAGRNRPGGPPFSSPVCWNCRCTEIFMIRGWDLVLPRCRRLYEPQVEVCTPCGSVSIRTIAVPGFLELQIHGSISDTEMGPYPPRVTLALQTPNWGFHTVRDGIDSGDHRFRPRFCWICTCMAGYVVGDDTLSSSGGAGSNPSQSAMSQWGRGFPTVRARSTRGTTVFVPSLLEL